MSQVPRSPDYWRSRGYVLTMGRLNHDHTPTSEAIAERHGLGPAEGWDQYKAGVLSALNDYIRRES